MFSTRPFQYPLVHEDSNGTWPIYEFMYNYSSSWFIPIQVVIFQFANLVGGLEHEFYFSIQLGISSSQLTNSYFSEG